MKKTKENADKTKQLIIETAYEVFKSVGYDKASLVDIAKNANLTRGAVYWHFKDKLELYEYVVRWKLIEITEEKESLFLDDKNNTLRDMIKNLLMLHIKDSDKYFFINQIVYFKLFHEELNNISIEVDNIKKIYFEKLEIYLNNTIHSNSKFDNELSRKMVSFIYTLFEGIHIYNLQKIRGVPLTESDIDFYTEMFMTGFNNIS